MGRTFAKLLLPKPAMIHGKYSIARTEWQMILLGVVRHMPINFENFVAFICIDPGNIVPLLVDSKPHLKLVARRNREIMLSEFIIKIGVLDRSRNINSVPPKSPLSVAPFHDRLHDVQIAVLFYYSRLCVRILGFVTDSKKFGVARMNAGGGPEISDTRPNPVTLSSLTTLPSIRSIERTKIGF